MKVQRSYERATPLEFTPHLSDYKSTLGLFGFSVAWGRLFKRETLIASGVKFPEHLPHEDLFFTYKLLRRSSHTFAEAHHYFWRQRRGSLSDSMTPAHLSVPWRLRQDTETFLAEASANDWEYALAAHRNLRLLRYFLKKAAKTRHFLTS